MTFEEILNQAMALLQRQGRVSYRALKRQFDLDEAYLEDIKLELIEVHQVAVDQDSTMLVWTGPAAALSPPVVAPVADRVRQPDTVPLIGLAETLTNRRILTVVAVWIVINFVTAMAVPESVAAGGIAWEVHLGGFVVGLLTFGAFDPPRRASS